MNAVDALIGPVPAVFLGAGVVWWFCSVLRRERDGAERVATVRSSSILLGPTLALLLVVTGVLLVLRLGALS